MAWPCVRACRACLPTCLCVHSPEKLKVLLSELSKFPNLSYHALNAKGDEYTNKEGKRHGGAKARPSQQL